MSYSRMKTNHHISEKDWELIAKSIYDENAESTSEDKNATAEALLPDDTELKQIIRTAKQVDSYFEQKNYDAHSAWKKVESLIHQNRMNQESKLRSIYLNPLFRMAAAVLIAALLLFSGYEAFKSPSSRLLTMVTSEKEVMNPISLPDGTLVSLNSNTKFSYPNEFSGNTREVTIEGEAFFQVKPNKNKPFIIHAGNAQIKVLGTSFNVNAYPNAKQVEVIVETGRVQFSNKNLENLKTNELILIQGDKGTLEYSSNSMIKMTNQNPNFIAWKTRNLIFKATPLSEVIEDLKKVYKVNIDITDPALNGLKLTAQYNDYKLDFILELIKSTFKSTFQIEVLNVNGNYVLKAKS